MGEERQRFIKADDRLAIRQDVLCIACRSGNLEMAVSILHARNTVWDQEQLMPLVQLPKLGTPRSLLHNRFLQKDHSGYEIDLQKYLGIPVIRPR